MISSNAADWPFGDLVPGAYRCVLLDPPWKFSAGTKGRPQHYPRMTDAEIAALPLAELADPAGCWFFVWITSPIDGPRFWEKIWPGWKKQGIHYSARMFVWLKTHKAGARGQVPMFIHRDSFHSGQGFTSRKNAEDCLLFKVGKPKRIAKNIREEIVTPIRAHSQKPEESYERIVRFCDGPRAELFARQERPNWSAWGNQTTRFNSPPGAALGACAGGESGLSVTA